MQLLVTTIHLDVPIAKHVLRVMLLGYVFTLVNWEVLAFQNVPLVGAVTIPNIEIEHSLENDNFRYGRNIMAAMRKHVLVTMVAPNRSIIGNVIAVSTYTIALASEQRATSYIVDSIRDVHL